MIGFIFNFGETWYFGWNLKPQSPEEMVCDYIARGLMLIGWLIVLYVAISPQKPHVPKLKILCPHSDSYDDCPDCRH
ncbi:MAG TPA: hypothetical protein PKA10_07700 [Selenomonadales bacterium]|nr:hypothetical protein [Selenomonadales bacterium]